MSVDALTFLAVVGASSIYFLAVAVALIVYFRPDREDEP